MGHTLDDNQDLNFMDGSPAYFFWKEEKVKAYPWVETQVKLLGT